MKNLRWIFVLPGAVTAMIVLYAMIINSTTHIPIPYIEYITEFFAGTIAAWAFVSAGVFIAPLYKRITALLLCVIFIIYSIYSILDPFLLYDDYGIFESVIYKIGGLLGCLVAYFQTEEDKIIKRH